MLATILALLLLADMSPASDSWHGPRTQNPSELDDMRRTWSAVLERDPYYNPNLTRDFPDYRLRLD